MSRSVVVSQDSFPCFSRQMEGQRPYFGMRVEVAPGGANGDYGDDLVQLIQRTVKPDFWDVNGGPGSIYFYRPLNALVIRATSEVHRDLGGALDGLRKAGGR